MSFKLVNFYAYNYLLFYCVAYNTSRVIADFVSNFVALEIRVSRRKSFDSLTPTPPDVYKYLVDVSCTSRAKPIADYNATFVVVVTRVDRGRIFLPSFSSTIPKTTGEALVSCQHCDTHWKLVGLEPATGIGRHKI